MSASTVARWNAIPLSRPDDSSSLKRPRPEGEDVDDNDEDISIVSRSPSPQPDSMDVDVHKYDEYVRGATREVITVETKIKSTNKGYAMLAKFGWMEGQPLGLSGDGRVDPVPFHLKLDSTGLGKTSQDVRMIETTVSQRRGLDSERQIKETDDQRQARESLVARKTALETEISSTLKAFYCTLCDKQFKNVAQYDEHTNSYAHHHKARFRDMQANVRIKDKDEAEKRKEKERRREEKELRKIAAANGIRMPKPPAPPIAITPSDPVANSSMEIDAVVPEVKKQGWATLSTTQPAAPQPSGFKKSGWATVGTATPPPPEPSSSSWTPATQPPPPPPPADQRPAAPSFRNAGWTSLDTGSSQPTPSQPSHFSAPPPPPPMVPPLVGGGWSTAVENTNTAQSLSHVPTPPLGLHSNPPQPPPTTQPVRTGWQQFQKKGPKRK